MKILQNIIAGMEINLNKVLSRKWPSLSHFLTCSLYLLLFSGCNKKTVEATQPQAYCIPDSLYTNITIDTAKSENVMGELILTGQISVDEEKEVKVYPLASGNTKEVKADLGDYVEKGQLLALVHSPDVANILSAAYTSARDLTIAKKQLDATQALYKAGIASEVDYITAQKDYEKQVSVTNANNEILRIYGGDTTNLSNYYIKAPISGYIVEKKISAGTEIRSDADDNLFTIADLSDVWALANVYEADIAKIKLGYDADVSSLSYGDKVFPGKVDKIFNIVTPDTKVMNVRVKLPNPGVLLKPGMYANIVVHYPEAQALLSVPSGAVVFEDNQNFVIRIKGKCDVEIQPIDVFRNLNGTAYIRQSKLQPGDRVVNRNCLYIYSAIKDM